LKSRRSLVPCDSWAFQGTFSIFIADQADGRPTLLHDTFIKVYLILESGEGVYRLPAWAKYACYVPEHKEYCAKHWYPAPEGKHVWKHARPTIVLDSKNVPATFGCVPFPTTAASARSDVVFHHALRIYEAHVGMSTSEERVGTYREFATDILPRIKALGYNCVQVRRLISGRCLCVCMFA
jgi:1,4-alpha-glucan branching enzyme